VELQYIYNNCMTVAKHGHSPSTVSTRIKMKLNSFSILIFLIISGCGKGHIITRTSLREPGSTETVNGTANRLAVVSCTVSTRSNPDGPSAQAKTETRRTDNRAERILHFALSF
jgi:hypothetical protein